MRVAVEITQTLCDRVKVGKAAASDESKRWMVETYLAVNYNAFVIGTTQDIVTSVEKTPSISGELDYCT